MRSFFAHLRLRWKIVLLILGLNGALGAAFTVALTPVLTGPVQRELEDRGELIVRHLVESVVDPFLVNDLLRLQQLVDGAMGLEDDLVYVFIGSRGSLPLVHTFPDGFPRDLLDAHQPDQEEGLSILRLATERGEIFDFAAPVLLGHNYYVHVGMSNVHLLQVLAAARNLGLAAVDRLGPVKRHFMAEALGLGGDLPRLARR